MRSASTGTPVRLRSLLADSTGSRAGYMLLEALVALALILAFAAVLGPVLLQARRIMSGADDRVAAQALLRSLLDVPLDRAALTSAKEGETAGLRWHITATPMHAEIAVRQTGNNSSAPSQNVGSGQNGNTSSGQAAEAQSTQQPVNWKAYRVVASVSWGDEHSISAETVRLGREQ